MNGASLKEFGMALAAVHGAEFLVRARALAREIVARKFEVSINDIREADPTLPSGNWMGSIFKTGNYYPIGWEESRHPKGHARPVRVWRLA